MSRGTSVLRWAKFDGTVAGASLPVVPSLFLGIKVCGKADNLGVRIRGTLEALCQNGGLAFRGFKVSA